MPLLYTPNPAKGSQPWAYLALFAGSLLTGQPFPRPVHGAKQRGRIVKYAGGQVIAGKHCKIGEFSSTANDLPEVLTRNFLLLLGNCPGVHLNPKVSKRNENGIQAIEN